ncbi:MAG: lasso RiPP family leader peptide-containing protein [Proteobacteria bacterium]|nr:MAG: lasso RiPP family leader peptide-containing protein [Pseudomonadota bacterium]
MSRSSAAAEPALISTEVSTPGSNAARKPYEKPVLELLGSVRDLTLGCTGGNLEGGKRRRPGAC